MTAGAEVSSVDPNATNFWTDLLNNEQASMWLGLAGWLLALVIVLIVVLVLAFGRHGHNNHMTSGRIYARRREINARPKRLLDDKYYHHDLQNKRKL